jgi:hypothetical protein
VPVCVTESLSASRRILWQFCGKDHKAKEKALADFVCKYLKFFGTEGETRTRKPLRAADFESFSERELSLPCFT